MARTIVLMVSGPANRFQDDFVLRTKQAREWAEFTQEQMAKLLQLDQGTYKNYETIRPLPHRYVVPFCLATKTNIEWLYTGRKARTPMPTLVQDTDLAAAEDKSA